MILLIYIIEPKATFVVLDSNKCWIQLSYKIYNNDHTGVCSHSLWLLKKSRIYKCI